MQQQQQEGGAQFGAPPQPETPSIASAGAAARAHGLQPPMSELAEAASPISSRPPAAAGFDELGPAMGSGFPDDEALGAGEEAERGGAPGNRWPRQETLALLKIRSDMDAAFRDATFKGPLWEEVSRKLAELGYRRTAKKCKEKFENVHKYYKRTKEGRAGRQDGKAYRFFTQLEALHGSGGGGANTTAATPLAAASPTAFSFATGTAGPPADRIQSAPVTAAAPSPVAMPARVAPELGPRGISSSAAAAAAAAAAAGISFSSDSSSTSSSESDDEETEVAGGSREGRKRKRRGGSRSRRQMMAFFEGLMQQVMERQEAMQQRFLEAIEKREQDRMKREEAWRLQEMSRLSREQELLVQERPWRRPETPPSFPIFKRSAARRSHCPPCRPPPSHRFLHSRRTLRLSSSSHRRSSSITRKSPTSRGISLHRRRSWCRSAQSLRRASAAGASRRHRPRGGPRRRSMR
ncbi:unnamed protein product [Musa textilis]